MIAMDTQDIGAALARQEEKIKGLDRRMDNLEKLTESVNALAIKRGVQALLRDRLTQGYKFHEKEGWADIDDRRNLENIYVQYHNLGQNGVMDDLRNKFLALPTHPPKEEEKKND